VGPLVLEHYDAGRFNFHPSTFLTDGREYLWFIGGAEILAKEVALAFISKNGPNHDFFEDGDAPMTACFENIIAAHLTIGQEGRSLMLWPGSPTSEAAFESLGFKSGDRFEFDSYARKNEPGYKTFERILGTNTPAGIRVPIQRSGKQIVVSIPSETMTRFLPRCSTARAP
jgi:hypothetical protein